MKYLNYIATIILLVASLYMFIVGKSDYDFVKGGVTLLCGIIFFLFSVIEEYKEEVESLRNKIDNLLK